MARGAVAVDSSARVARPQVGAAEVEPARLSEHGFVVRRRRERDAHDRPLRNDLPVPLDVPRHDPPLVGHGWGEAHGLRERPVDHICIAVARSRRQLGVGEDGPKYVPKRIVNGRASGRREEVDVRADVVVAEDCARGVGLDEPLEQVVWRGSQPPLLQPLRRPRLEFAARGDAGGQLGLAADEPPGDIAREPEEALLRLAIRDAEKRRHHEPGEPEREGANEVDVGGQSRHDRVRGRFHGGAKDSLERRADEVGRDPRSLVCVSFSVVLGERVAHDVREPGLVDPRRIRGVVAEHCGDIVVAGEQVDLVNGVVEERRVVPKPLPYREGVARERIVVQARRIDRGADAHATFSGKWHAVRLGVAPRSTNAGRSTVQRSCAFQQRDAKMQPGTG